MELKESVMQPCRKINLVGLGQDVYTCRLVTLETSLPSGNQPRSQTLHRVIWPRLDTQILKCSNLGLLLCTIFFPNHISGLFSQGLDLSLTGTKLPSAVEQAYPAERAVRCNKLMETLTLRRRCQGAGVAAAPPGSLWWLRALMWHGNVFQASPRRCLRALIPLER